MTPKLWVLPYNSKVKLNQEVTEEIVGGLDLDDLDPSALRRPESRTSFRHAPPLVVHRESWEMVGGMDERMQGWGQEDVAFSLALEKVVGPQRMLRGNALHLWHPRIGRAGSDLWEGQESQAANIELMRGYRRARTAEDIRALREVVPV